MPAWDDIPEDRTSRSSAGDGGRAGFAEHVDVQVGRIVDEVDALGYGENTLVFYIWGDNGSSGEGQNGTISELLAQNGIPTTLDMHLKALDELGGLDVLGSPKVDNQYHAGWAWAGSTPYKGLKLVGLAFRRHPQSDGHPLAGEDPPDATPRPQFHHCNDVVPTIYEVVGITPPRVVNGIQQDPIDGVSFTYAFDDASAPGRLRTQYFEIMGSRASTTMSGWPLPSGRGCPGFRVCLLESSEWTPTRTLGAVRPRLRLEPSQRPRGHPSREARPAEESNSPSRPPSNSVFPIGGGLWIPVFHPELRISTPYREWNFTGDITRMPEFCAPALGNRANVVTIDADMPENANGVLTPWGARGVASRVISMTESSATSTTSSSSCAPRSAPRSNCRPADRRSGSIRPSPSRAPAARSMSA